MDGHLCTHSKVGPTNQPNSPEKIPLTLTERLASERNRLANERTLLAYVRTGLALIVSGTGFSKFLDSPIERLLFMTFIPIGIMVLIFGFVRFRQQQRILAEYSRKGLLSE